MRSSGLSVGKNNKKNLSKKAKKKAKIKTTPISVDSSEFLSKAHNEKKIQCTISMPPLVDFGSSLDPEDLKQLKHASDIIITLYLEDKNIQAQRIAYASAKCFIEDCDNLYDFQDFLIEGLLNKDKNTLQRCGSIIKYAPKLIELFTLLEKDGVTSAEDNQLHLCKIYQLQAFALFMTAQTHPDAVVNEALMKAINIATEIDLNLPVLISYIGDTAQLSNLNNFETHYLSHIPTSTPQFLKVHSKSTRYMNKLISQKFINSEKKKQEIVMPPLPKILDAPLPLPSKGSLTSTIVYKKNEAAQTLFFQALSKFQSSKHNIKDKKISLLKSAISILKNLQETYPLSYEAQKTPKLIYKYLVELGSFFCETDKEKNLLEALVYYNEALALAKSSTANLPDIYRSDAYLQRSFIKLLLANLAPDKETRNSNIEDAHLDLREAQKVKDPTSKIIIFLTSIQICFNDLESPIEGYRIFKKTIKFLERNKKIIAANKNELYTPESYTNKLRNTVAIVDNYIRQWIETIYTDLSAEILEKILGLNAKFISLMEAADEDECSKYLVIAYERLVLILPHLPYNSLQEMRFACEKGLAIIERFPPLREEFSQAFYNLTFQYANTLLQQNDLINSKKYAELALPYQDRYSKSKPISALLKWIKDQEVSPECREALSQWNPLKNALEKSEISIDGMPNLLELLTKIQVLRSSYIKTLGKKPAASDSTVLTINQLLTKGYEKLKQSVELLANHKEKKDVLPQTLQVLTVVPLHLNNDYSDFGAIELILQSYLLRIKLHIKNDKQLDVLIECKEAQAFIGRVKTNKNISIMAKELYNLQSQAEKSFLKKIGEPIQSASEEIKEIFLLKEKFHKTYRKFKNLQQQKIESPTNVPSEATQLKETLKEFSIKIQSKYDEINPKLIQAQTRFSSIKSLLSDSAQGFSKQLTACQSSMSKISEFLSSRPMTKVERLSTKIEKAVQHQVAEAAKAEAEKEALRAQHQAAEAAKAEAEKEVLRVQQQVAEAEKAEAEKEEAEEEEIEARLIHDMFALELPPTQHLEVHTASSGISHKEKKTVDSSYQNVLNKIALLNANLRSTSPLNAYRLCVVMRGTAVLQFLLDQGAKKDISIKANDFDLFIYNAPSVLPLPVYNGQNKELMDSIKLKNHSINACNAVLSNLLIKYGFIKVARLIKSNFYENYYNAEEKMDITICRTGYYSYDPFHFTRSGLGIDDNGVPYIFAEELKKDIENKKFELDLPIVGDKERRVTSFFTRLIKYYEKLKDVAEFKLGNNFQEALSKEWQVDYFKKLLGAHRPGPKHPLYLEIISIIKNGQLTPDNALAIQIVSGFCEAIALITYGAMLGETARQNIVETLIKTYSENLYALENFYYYLVELFNKQANLTLPHHTSSHRTSQLHFFSGYNTSPVPASTSPGSSLSFSPSPSFYGSDVYTPLSSSPSFSYYPASSPEEKAPRATGTMSAPPASRGGKRRSHHSSSFRGGRPPMSYSVGEGYPTLFLPPRPLAFPLSPALSSPLSLSGETRAESSSSPISFPSFPGSMRKP